MVVDFDLSEFYFERTKSLSRKLVDVKKKNWFNFHYSFITGTVSEDNSHWIFRDFLFCVLQLYRWMVFRV